MRKIQHGLLVAPSRRRIPLDSDAGATPRCTRKITWRIGYCLDITDRKELCFALQESEQRFRSRSEISSVAAGLWPDLVTYYWNQASETWRGYRAEEAIGRKLTDLIIPPEIE